MANTFNRWFFFFFSNFYTDFERFDNVEQGMKHVKSEVEQRHSF